MKKTTIFGENTRILHSICVDDGEPVCFYTTTPENEDCIDGYKILIDSNSGRLRQITQVTNDQANGFSIFYNPQGDETLNNHRIRKFLQFKEGKPFVEFYLTEDVRQRNFSITSDYVVCITHPDSFDIKSHHTQTIMAFEKNNPRYKKNVDKVLKRVIELEKIALTNAQNFFGTELILKNK